MATKKITLNELRSLVKKIIKEEQLRFNKGQIITLLTKDGDNNGEVTVDTADNSTIIGYMKSQSATPIKVKIVQSKNRDGYDVYGDDGTMIRNNQEIVLKK
jgi:hypothetical protein